MLLVNGNAHVVNLIAYVSRPATLIVPAFNTVLFNELFEVDSPHWNSRAVKRNLVADIAGGLNAIHRLNIVHNRLTSKNIMLRFSEGEQWNIYISDFGSSMLMSGDAAKSDTNDGVFVAVQPRYTAPEVLKDMRNSLHAMTHVCSKASDIYQLGLLIYEIAMRDLPYPRMEEQQVKQMLTSGRNTESVINNFNRKQLGEFEDFVAACTQFDPSRRPSITTLL